MKKHLYLVVCFCLLLAMARVAMGQQSLGALEEPFAAPDFTAQAEDGQTYRLSDYRGKYVVLNFWATWCPPCREEIPGMERLWQKLQDRNVQLLAVNVGEDPDTIFKFLGNYPMSFPCLLDPKGTIIDSYPVAGLPTTYIINPQGMVTHRAVGSRQWDDEDLIQQILGGK